LLVRVVAFGYLVTLSSGLLTAPLAAELQQTVKGPGIGVLAPGTPTPGNLPLRVFDAFRQGLRDLGYVEGETVVLALFWSSTLPGSTEVKD